MSVLALDNKGVPRRWISYNDAITYVATNSVVWSLGPIVARYRGGHQRNGIQSILETPAIIAIGSNCHNSPKLAKVSLTNKTLFARDRYTCALCGTTHADHKNLSREHIIPRSRGGADSWTNVVTACRNCNSKKSNKTLEECGLQLIYVPYEPSHHENMILQNRNILADQMEYLLAGVPKHSRILLPKSHYERPPNHVYTE